MNTIGSLRCNKGFQLDSYHLVLYVCQFIFDQHLATYTGVHYMMQRALPPQNRTFREFLQRGLDVEHPRTSFLAELHEFEDCRYKLERCVDYSVATMCFFPQQWLQSAQVWLCAGRKKRQTG